jgi:hypothetical protein
MQGECIIEEGRYWPRQGFNVETDLFWRSLIAGFALPKR